MPHRQVAIVSIADDRPASRHFIGIPPQIEAGGGHQALPWPRIAVIVERSDGVFLERFVESGELVGDTWHMTIDEAKEQAVWEYAELLGPWHVVPDEIDDDDIPEYVRANLERPRR